jgi:metallo-beta-lactamase family protein
VEFAGTGHLLGSAYVVVRLAEGQTILFGGDLGRYNRPVLPDPEPPVAADVVLLESTYGDRVHADDDDGGGLAAVIRDTAAVGGKLIIPAFAIGRVEELLYWIRRLERQERIPVLPAFLDSPMAITALRFYTERAAELDPDMQPTQKEVSAFVTARFQSVSSPQQSKELTASRRSAIVISSSGMATGGRVLHHLEKALPEERNTVLFVGYQADGTRGRTLVEGASEVKIHGRIIPVRAKIAKIDSMSAHADRREIIRWLGMVPEKPRQLHLVHGDSAPMHALKSAIHEHLGWECNLPAYRDTVTI